jgi:hypothetical protein
LGSIDGFSTIAAETVAPQILLSDSVQNLSYKKNTADVNNLISQNSGFLGGNGYYSLVDGYF